MARKPFVPDTHNKVLHPHIETFFERYQRHHREAETRKAKVACMLETYGLTIEDFIDWLGDKDIKPVETYNLETYNPEDE